MGMNLFIGVLVSAVIIILGGTDDEGEREACSDRSNRGNSGTKRDSAKKRNRPGSTLTLREKTERIKLKTARLNYLTEKLKGNKKHEPVIEKQSDVTGSQPVNHSGTQSDRSDGKTTVNDTVKKRTKP